MATRESSLNRIRAFLCCAVFVAAFAGYQQVAGAVSQPLALIVEPVSDSKLATLAGNTRPEATAANDRGPVAADLPLDHMLLQLLRSPEREQALDKYINQLEDPKSPNYHHWLTAQELRQRYGLAAQDIDTITNWLKSHGFTVNRVYPNGLVIDFSGNAGQVQEAFHTEIHHLDVHGATHIANMSDPRIPAALAPVVAGVVSLNDFRPQANYTYNCPPDTCYALAPADLATIYNFNPLFSGGISGQGQTIVVVEESDVYSLPDWTTFRATFGLSSYTDGSVSQVHPGCDDPGFNTNEGEAIIDAEWASAAAPSATIVLASCANTTTPGEIIAMENLLNTDGTSTPAIVSNSYGQAETVNGSTLNAAINSLYQTAEVVDGVSVFVAAGDSGGAYADEAPVNAGSEFAASMGITVNGSASTPYNVAVGGTDFSDTYAGTNSTYWNESNTADYGSAISYIPEIPWNYSCAGELLVSSLGYPSQFGSASLCNEGGFLDITAGAGGPSGCATGAPSTPGVVSGSCHGYAKPAWQSILGNPSDGVRDIPDVSLFASDGPWDHGYVQCDSDPVDGGGCVAGVGGTSFAAPIMAGIQALVNQKLDARQGNPNPAYYSLAAAEYGTSGSSSCNSSKGNAVGSKCIFYDITEGDSVVPCTGSNNCYDPSGTYGVLSTFGHIFRARVYGDGWMGFHHRYRQRQCVQPRDGIPRERDAHPN